MGLRAFARVVYSPAGTPSATVRKGFSAPADTATGRTTFTLTRGIDRTEGCVLASFLASTTTQPQATIDADIATGDTTVEVRVRGSTGVLADPLAGSGFHVAVLDDVTNNTIG